MAAACLAFGGCGRSGNWIAPQWAAEPRAAEPAPDEIDTRLLLIGDAGLPEIDAVEPVLQALSAEAATLADRTCIVFLGDNVYPHGLPPEAAGDRALAERRLNVSLQAAARSGARAVFVPGNHDYALDGWVGWERERAWIESRNHPGVQARPLHGGPGPDVLDLGAQARLVFLDSERWLQGGVAGADPRQTDRRMTAQLDSVLAAAGSRHVIVMAHHPRASHGPHGGFFTWRDHLFPLTAAASWAWIPLPVVGSLYPLARRLGITHQDLSSGRYRALRRGLEQAFLRHPPLAAVGGHEHTLQVLESPGGGWNLVSGAGTISRSEAVGQGADSRFTCGCPGFMKLDLLRDGRVRLEVIEVDAVGRVSRPLARWLAAP